jgi:multidrug efflux pump subunit AcrA (membrane-fusion protein)
MGEQRPNQDAKVYEVRVELMDADTTLRPGMTTGNLIETISIPNVLSIPLEAMSSAGGIPFVYKASGAKVSKQEVQPGAMNDDEVVIVKGLAEEDRVLLSPPEDKDKLNLVRLPGSGTPPKPAAGGDTALGPRTIPPASAPPPKRP